MEATAFAPNLTIHPASCKAAPAVDEGAQPMSSVVLGGIVFSCLVVAILFGMAASIPSAGAPSQRQLQGRDQACHRHRRDVVGDRARPSNRVGKNEPSTMRKPSLRGSAAEIVLLDRVLAHYGPETQEARGLLRDFIVSRLDGPSAENTGDELEIEAVQDKVRSLAPETARPTVSASAGARGQREDC